tara:strand:- start:20302 stop:21000 length:699 start_codon:yes stop_codon:yes gene_type:complete
MSSRRTEILKELRLAPFWSERKKKLTSKIVKLSNLSITKGDERKFQILKSDWTELEEEVTTCASCSLFQRHTRTSLRTGDKGVNWLYISSMPDVEEGIQGEPCIIGPTGQLLDNVLRAISLEQNYNVYIADIVKSKSSSYKKLNYSAFLQCESFLIRQIELIQPKIIIALGKFIAQSLLNTTMSFDSLRGKLHIYSGIPLVVTYHPSYLLEMQYDKKKVWEDLCFAKNIIQN